MQTEEFRAQVLATVPEAKEPSDARRDDLYPFTFVSAVFVPAYMDALTGTAQAASDDAAGNGSQERLRTLSDLLERALDEGDGEIVDALAMRVVQGRLCQRPDLLEVALPYLGPVTRSVVGKFQTLVAECDQRAEAAARSGVNSAHSQ